MNCAGCGFQIESGFAFCPKCGAKQPKVCQSCGFACAPDFAFCPRCGTSVGAAPAPTPAPGPGSGTRPAVTPASPIAINGTAALDRSPPAREAQDAEADRRTVTVLFADLSGFTSLSERLDPEVMQSLQNELFKELTEAVQSFGGFVDKFIGDALLALFGAPVAHEDDPERALGAALDMLARTARIGERSAAFAGLPLELH